MTTSFIAGQDSPCPDLIRHVMMSDDDRPQILMVEYRLRRCSGVSGAIPSDKTSFPDPCPLDAVR